MKKAQFYTRIFRPVCQDRQEALKVNGYTFNHFDHEFGCYKDGCYGWYVVDLGSGLAIVGRYPTRKKIMEEFYDEDLQERMIAEFESNGYQEKVDIFNKMIEKAKESEGK